MESKTHRWSEAHSSQIAWELKIETQQLLHAPCSMQAIGVAHMRVKPVFIRFLAVTPLATTRSCKGTSSHPLAPSDSDPLHRPNAKLACSMDEETEDQNRSNLGVSLSRLRLFLAPHASPASPRGSGSGASLATNPTSNSPTRLGSNPPAGTTATTTMELSENATSVASLSPRKDNQEPDPNRLRRELADATMESTIPSGGAAASISPLHSSTKEFARVKYLLQCSLPGHKVHDDVMIWDMRNPALVAQYEQHTSGFLELDSWVSVNDLGSSMTEMHSYGFTSLNSGTGMKFTTGTLVLENPGKKGRRQYVLCKIAVGRSLVIDSESQANRRLPSGYNSFYIDLSSRAKLPSNPEHQSYYHEYILNNTLQILPQYLVRFSYSEIEQKAAPNCALCEKNPAAIVCRACEAEICTKCDQEVHSANKLVSRHKRFPFNASGAGAGGSDTTALLEDLRRRMEEGSINLTAMCRFHESKQVEFYCPVCSLPVCVHCKMIGDHSCGDKGSHRLISIADAYEMSMRESTKADPLIESRKSVINNKLKLIEERTNEIQANKQQVEDAIRQMMHAALAKLEEEVGVKVGALRGEKLELKRQLEHIEWAEKHLSNQRTSLQAVDFLNTWNQHKLLRAELREFPVAHLPSAEKVLADLQVIGRLQVVTGETLVAGNVFGGEDLAIVSGSTAGGTSASSLGSIRCSTENEIRKKLLSYKSVSSSCDAASSCGVGVGASPYTMLSTKGLKMMEEIRLDLVQGHGLATTTSNQQEEGANAGSQVAPPPPPPPALQIKIASPVFAESVHKPENSSLGGAGLLLPPNPLGMGSIGTHKMDYSSTLRGFSVHSSRKKNPHRRQKTCNDVWSNYLKQEMGIPEADK